MTKHFDNYPVRPHFTGEYHDKCRHTLEAALAHVPAYAAWRAFDPGPGVSTDARYAAMPALDKAWLREHFPHGFTHPSLSVEDGLASKDIEYVQTSGTTDERVTNLWNQEWWDSSERASWDLNSHTRAAGLGNHREALLTSALSVGFRSDDKDIAMADRRLDRFLFLNEKSSPALWTPYLMDRMLAELAEFRPAVLEANPSYLSRLARYALSRSIAVHQPDLVVLTFELPACTDYRPIRSVFSCPLCSSFGSTETGYVLMECEEGRYHQNTASCRIDYQPLDAAHGGPNVGRILVTTFGNDWCYLLRFTTGDLVRLDDRGPCPCGRRDGITVSRIEGRIKNLTLTDGGRLVTEHELDDALGRVENLAAYQLVQEDVGRVRLHVVAEDASATNALRNTAEAAMKSVYGKATAVDVVIEKELAATPSGKFRRVQAEFNVPVESYLDHDYA